MAEYNNEAAICPYGQRALTRIDLNDRTIYAAHDLLSTFVPSKIDAVIVVEALAGRISITISQVDWFIVSLCALGEQPVITQGEAEEICVYDWIFRIPE